jgi:hypothetical protein
MFYLFQLSLTHILFFLSLEDILPNTLSSKSGVPGGNSIVIAINMKFLITLYESSIFHFNPNLYLETVP